MTLNHFLSFLTSQALIWLPLLAGNHLRRLGWLKESVSKPLITINLMAFAPVIFTMGIWRLDRSLPKWFMAPLLLALLLAVSTLISMVISPRLSHKRTAVGTYIFMIPLCNIGHTMAGYLTLLLLPDEIFPYNVILMWPMTIFALLVWLPLGIHLGHGRRSFLRSYGQAVRSPIAMPLVGVLTGSMLNASGIPMPDICFVVLKVMVFAATILMMFAIGCRLHFHRLKRFFRLLGVIHIMKFLVHPMIMVSLCLLFEISGDLAGVLFIASCMPCGVQVVSMSTLFDLDVDLANAGYIWTTVIFMILILPLMILGLQAPLFQTP